MKENSEFEKAIWQLIQVKDEIKADKKTSLNALKEVIMSLDETSKRFIAHFEEFEGLIEQVPNTLGEQLNSSTEQAANQIVKHIHQSVDDKLNIILSGLKSSAYQAQQALENTGRSLTHRTLLMTVCFCSGSLISAMLIVWFVVQRPPMALTPDMAKTYQLGLILKKTLPKLSIKDQGYIKKVLKL
jgi:hypothetical protein